MTIIMIIVITTAATTQHNDDIIYFKYMTIIFLNSKCRPYACTARYMILYCIYYMRNC